MDNSDNDNGFEEFIGKNLPGLRNAYNIRKAVGKLASPASKTGVALLEAVEARAKLSKERSMAKTAEQTLARTETERKILDVQLEEQERVDEIVLKSLQRIYKTSKSSPKHSEDLVGEISDDFLDVFRREAGLRSSEQIKESFSRILAGEIEQPGTFSINTLRTVGALDERTANIFVRAVSASVRIRVRLKTDTENRLDDARIPALDGNLGDNSLANLGLSYGNLMKLVENGLLFSDFSAWGQYQYGIRSLPDWKDLVIDFTHQDQHWTLLPEQEFCLDKDEGLKLFGVAFTTVGKELMDIVDLEQLPDFTNRIAEYFSGLKLMMEPINSSTA